MGHQEIKNTLKRTKPEFKNAKQAMVWINIKDFLKDIYLKIRKILLIPFLFIRSIKTLKGNDIKTILFLRHDRIGDMVLSTPVFKALRRRFPLAILSVLASERNHEVIQNNPDVDEILIYKGNRMHLFSPEDRELHPYHFTPETIRLALEKTGFKVVRIIPDMGIVQWPIRIMNYIEYFIGLLTGTIVTDAIEIHARPMDKEKA